MPWQYPVHGIDVSKYQGDIDWHRVRASGIDFAFIKATEGGDHADDRFARELGAPPAPPACRAAPTTTTTSAARRPSRRPGSSTTSRATARRCRRCSTSSGPTSRGPAPTAPTPPPCAREARIFLQALTAYYGKRPVIYTTVDFYRDNELWRLDGYHFWLRSVAGHPSEVYPGQRWAFWQYTGTGVVDGHRRPDRPQRLRGGRGQWAAWMAGEPELRALYPRAPGSVSVWPGNGAGRRRWFCV